MIISALMLPWWLRAQGDESADVFVCVCGGGWVTDSIYTAEHWGQKVGGKKWEHNNKLETHKMEGSASV